MTSNSIDFNLCILCRKQTNENLVENPTSHQKVCEFVEKWAKNGSLFHYDLWTLLSKVTADDLKARKATWHRSCYQETTHSGKLKRAIDRYQLMVLLLLIYVNGTEIVRI